MPNDYKIAVLLPTRGRTSALDRSVKGLINRAVDPDHIQIMFGIDNDDSSGREYFKQHIQPWLDQRGVAYTAMGFDPIGYGRLNEYVNTLARASAADWLFFWNDDALMETTGWDRVITSHTGEFKILAVHTHQDHPYSIFPIVPREWLDALGHLSPHQLSDAWLSQLAYQLDVWQRVEIYVTHDRADLTGNNQDATFKNRVMHEGNPQDPKDFHSYPVTMQRLEECNRLAVYMRQRGLDTSWWENVLLNRQDPWAKLRANDVNSQMKQYAVNFKL